MFDEIDKVVTRLSSFWECDVKGFLNSLTTSKCFIVGLLPSISILFDVLPFFSKEFKELSDALILVILSFLELGL